MARMLLVLQRSEEQEAGLRKLLEDQQVKSSPSFHQWLTPEEFGQRFGPAEADIQAVTAWLTGQGFEVNHVAAGRAVIEFSGTAGLVRQSLHTEIHRFVIHGEEHWANLSDPQIPAALAPVVAGVASLHNFPRKPQSRRLGTFRRSKLTGQVQPLFTFPWNGAPNYALGPGDFATIYNVQPLWTAGTTGAGQTIAVVGQTNIDLQDVRDFRSMFGLPANDPNIILNGPDPGITADEGESDLDVEWSGAVARDATIDLVVSESTVATVGIDLSALYIIDNNLAPVMSESYGGCEAGLGASGNQFYNNLWEQAAAQGITVVLATGDSGSAGCDFPPETAAQYGLGVNGLASTPFNVAVGGTDFDDATNPSAYWNTTNNSSQTSAKSYIPESTWNDSCARSGLSGCPTVSSYGSDLVAGGGGPSSCVNGGAGMTCAGYAKPAWQGGAGVPSDGARDLPDISLFAGDGLNDSYYVVCQMDANVNLGGDTGSCDLNSPYANFQGAGGASASAQTFAGILALVNQAHGPQGNANYVLYPLAAKTGASCNSSTAPPASSTCIFYDVTKGNNSVACVGGSPECSNPNAGGYGVIVSGNSPAWPTTARYDLATGLGSVNVANLVNNWTSVSFHPTTTTLPSLSPTNLTHGQPVQFTISVTSSSGTPSGDVSLIAQTGTPPGGSTGIGGFTLSGGSFSGTTTLLPGGSYGVIARYAGDGAFGASDSAPTQVTGGKENSQTTISLVTFDASGNPSYGATTTPYGSPYVLRVDVMSSSGQKCAASTGAIAYPCPTGTVTVAPPPTDQAPPPNTTPGSYALNSQGIAEDWFAQLGAQTWPFTATYPGDNSYNQSSSTKTITITPAQTTTTLNAPTSAVGIISITATITTQSNGVAPTGTVQFLNNGVMIGGPANVVGTPYSASSGAYATAQANLSTSVATGTLTITAQYSGDGNYAPSNSAPATITVTDYTMSANPSTINISAAGQSGASTITLTPLNGFKGTVNLSCLTGYVGVNCTVSPSSVNITGPSAGSATLTVTTTAQVSATAPTPQLRVPPSYRPPFGWPWLLAGALALAALISLATARRRPAGWLFASTLLVVGVWAACGSGGGGSPQTPVPVVSLSPASLTFAQQGIGSASTLLNVTLFNTGNALLSISGIAIGGTNPGDFAQTNNCGSSVAAGVNCAINVTFTPTAVGSRSASLTITDNASGSPQTVSLTGTGVQAPAVSLSPQSLAFGPENAGSTTAPRTVTLSNIGSALLSISNIAVGDGDWVDFHQTNNCGSTVPVGSSCTISVTFSPSPGIIGSVYSSIYIADNASDSPQRVSLSATGVPAVTPPGTYWVSVDGDGAGYTHVLQLTVTEQ
jgi:hypothetical protein